MHYFQSENINVNYSRWRDDIVNSFDRGYCFGLNNTYNEVVANKLQIINSQLHKFTRSNQNPGCSAIMDK